MARALSDYYDRIVWVNFTIYALYFLIKYVIGGILLCDVIRQKKRGHYEEEERPDDNESIASKSLPWLIILAFGKQLGLKDASKLHKLHIKTTGAMSYCGQISVFYVVIIGSLILALGSALDLTLFTPSRICTEDPSTDCYPQLISGANGTDLTLPIDVSEPILDCSYWTSEGVSRQVTFFCFQQEFNFDLFVAVIGGLLAFTFIALNASIGFLLRITQSCMTKINLKCMFWIRIIFIGIVIVIELAMAILCLALGVTRVSPDTVDDDPGVTFLTMHASEILATVGIVATLLWLPWEEYVEAQKQHQQSSNSSSASQPDHDNHPVPQAKNPVYSSSFSIPCSCGIYCTMNKQLPCVVDNCQV